MTFSAGKFLEISCKGYLFQILWVVTCNSVLLNRNTMELFHWDRPVCQKKTGSTTSMQKNSVAQCSNFNVTLGHFDDHGTI